MQTEIKKGGRIILIPPSLIHFNTSTSRENKDIDYLEKLADSIRNNGVIQPLTVRPHSNAYLLINGDSRLRAAKIAGLNRVPCIIMKAGEKETLIFSYLENSHRQALSCFEEAEIISTLINRHGFLYEDLYKTLGLEQPEIDEKLRLLRLSEDQKKAILASSLSERQIKTLLLSEHEEDREKLLSELLQKDLNPCEAKEFLNEQRKNRLSSTVTQSHKTLYKDSTIFINTIDKAIETMKNSEINALRLYV